MITVTLKDGTTDDYGSELIAQEFTKPEYLIGRPLGTTNLSPVSEEQEALVQERIAWWHSFDPDNTADIPDGPGHRFRQRRRSQHFARSGGVSGGAELPRRAGMREDCGARRSSQNIQPGGSWASSGEPAVNVLKVNLALDGLICSDTVFGR